MFLSITNGHSAFSLAHFQFRILVKCLKSHGRFGIQQITDLTLGWSLSSCVTSGKLRNLVALRFSLLRRKTMIISGSTLQACAMDATRMCFGVRGTGPGCDTGSSNVSH